MQSKIVHLFKRRKLKTNRHNSPLNKIQAYATSHIGIISIFTNKIVINNDFGGYVFKTGVTMNSYFAPYLFAKLIAKTKF